jgi:signal recognition particle subunit SRP54
LTSNAIAASKANGFNALVIVDTAGRLAVDEEMMNEIANVHKANSTTRNFVRCRCNDRSRW